MNDGKRGRAAALTALGAMGWACSWTVGVFVINNFSRGFGWLVMGFIAGLATAAVLRRGQPDLDGAYLSAIMVGWTIGGVAAGGVAQFDILRGWIAMGLVGGSITGATVLKTNRRRVAAGIAGVAAGWLVAGIAGACFGLGYGREIGVRIGELLSGPLQSFAVSGAIWAIAGGVTGAIGCASMLAQIGLREAADRSRISSSITKRSSME